MSIKEAYKEKLESQLEEWKAQIKVLKAKAGKLKADAKMKAEKELDSLAIKQEEASLKLKDLKKAGDDAFEQAKAATELFWEEIKSGMDAIKKYFVE